MRHRRRPKKVWRETSADHFDRDIIHAKKQRLFSRGTNPRSERMTDTRRDDTSARSLAPAAVPQLPATVHLVRSEKFKLQCF
jgi:hypothetical protein